MRERQRLLRRIQQARGVAAAPATAPVPADEPADSLRALEARMRDLEQLVQGLQDSVYREAKRQGQRLSELEARIRPAEMNRALSEDARERGL